MYHFYDNFYFTNLTGTESGIRNNIEPICDMLKKALESPSWTLKAQVSL